MRSFNIMATDTVPIITLSQPESRLIAKNKCATFTHPVASSNLAFDDSVIRSIGYNQSSSNLFTVDGKLTMSVTVVGYAI
ncbi:hypothetical protein TNCT_401181 [Trichonephila clavata]|uniref:Uncharacterized protein n=1 Tax=Trichonephila clavata TaxID=2740835 RepID=A0A8X6LIS9_TRICU|nr:hypothetical protein TNCT_401181 [Trichonephila clavata]